MLPRATRHRLDVLVLTLVVALARGEGLAHDASAWGGLFRTRDAGATWPPVNPASFVSGALAVAVSPVEPQHLLLATDVDSRARATPVEIGFPKPETCWSAPRSRWRSTSMASARSPPALRGSSAATVIDGARSGFPSGRRPRGRW